MNPNGRGTSVSLATVTPVMPKLSAREHYYLAQSQKRRECGPNALRSSPIAVAARALWASK